MVPDIAIVAAIVAAAVDCAARVGTLAELINAAVAMTTALKRANKREEVGLIVASITKPN